MLPSDLNSKRLNSICVLREQMSNGASNNYLMLHVEMEKEDRLQVLPLFEAAKDQKEFAPMSLPVPQGSRFAVSPTESIVAMGSPSGTLAIWFLTPSWSTPASPIFNLEGHRGAVITAMQFSNDGKTLVTADSSSRLYGWLSESVHPN